MDNAILDLPIDYCQQISRVNILYEHFYFILFINVKIGKTLVILQFKKIFIQKQTDHNEDDDLIPHLQTQIKVSRNPGEILSIPNKMAELVVNYTQNNFVRTLVQVCLKEIYILTDIYDLKLYNQTWTYYNLTIDYLKILQSTELKKKHYSCY